jgi:hypothetical protein
MSDVNDFRSAEQQLQQAALLFSASFSFEPISEPSPAHIYATEDLLFSMVNAFLLALFIMSYFPFSRSFSLLTAGSYPVTSVVRSGTHFFSSYTISWNDAPNYEIVR